MFSSLGLTFICQIHKEAHIFLWEFPTSKALKIRPSSPLNSTGECCSILPSLISLIFFKFCLVNLAKRLLILLIFSNKQLFVSLILCCCLHSCLINLYLDYLSLHTGLGYWLLLSIQGLKVHHSVVWVPFDFFMYVLRAINLLFRTALIVSHRFIILYFFILENYFAHFLFLQWSV